MIAFRYPRTRHKRRERPGQLSTYQQYKPFLRREFDSTCVYCRMPDLFNGRASNYGADHYRPKSKFPHLATEYCNLFYSCNPCNSHKGAYWPEPRHERVRFVPNPCDHAMHNHLRFQDCEVVSPTPAGRHAILLFDLNDPEAIKLRRLVADLVTAQLAQREKLLRTIAKLRKVPRDMREAAAKEIGRLQADVARIDGDLATSNVEV